MPHACRFVHYRSAWYASQSPKGWGEWLDEVAIEVYDPEADNDGALGGEVFVRWYDMGNDRFQARLEVADGAWTLIGNDGPLHDLVHLLAGWGSHPATEGQTLTPSMLCGLLQAGPDPMVDATPTSAPCGRVLAS